MPYDMTTNLWPFDDGPFFREEEYSPILQQGPHCVSTCLAMLTRETPEHFQKLINTQNPVTWSLALNSHGLKLAYCPTDVRKLKYYLDELLRLNGLFLLCYYSPIEGSQILCDPNASGWICGSHVVILRRDTILDPAQGRSSLAKTHGCGSCHTKRIFRVVPLNHARGL